MVNVVLVPAQIAVAPDIVGLFGKLFTDTVIVLLTAEIQPVTVFLILKE